MLQTVCSIHAITRFYGLNLKNKIKPYSRHATGHDRDTVINTPCHPTTTCSISQSRMPSPECECLPLMRIDPDTVSFLGLSYHPKVDPCSEMTSSLYPDQCCELVRRFELCTHFLSHTLYPSLYSSQNLPPSVFAPSLPDPRQAPDPLLVLNISWSPRPGGYISPRHLLQVNAVMPACSTTSESVIHTNPT